MNLMDSELAISCSTDISKNADSRNLIPSERKGAGDQALLLLLFQEAVGVLLHSAQAWSLLCQAMLARETRVRDWIQDSVACVSVFS